MAGLTAELNTDFQTARVIEPGSPSVGASTALKALSQGLSIFTNMNRANAAAKRQASQDALAAGQRQATLAADLGIAQVQAQAAQPGPLVVDQEANQPEPTNVPSPGFTGHGVFDPVDSQPAIPDEVKLAAARATGSLQNIAASVEQGRMPGISLNAAINTKYLALLNQFPDQAAAIDSVFREKGLNPSLARPLLDEQSDHDSQREANEKNEARWFELGAKSLPPATLAGSSREEVIAAGIRQDHSDFNLSQAQAQATLTLSNQQATSAQRTAAQQDLDANGSNQFELDAYNQTAGFIKGLRHLSDAMLTATPTSQQEAEFQKLAPRINSWINDYKANALARAAQAGMSVDAQTKLASKLDEMTGRARDAFGTTFGVAQANNAALNALANGAKINAAQAMPIFFALKEAGLTPAVIQGLSDSLATGDPAFRNSLAAEVRGFTTDWARERASTRMMKIVSMIRGETNLQELDPNQQRALIPNLYTTAQNLATSYNQGKEVPVDNVVHTVSQIIVATNTVTPNSGLDTWVKASIGSGGLAVRSALIRAAKDPSADHPMVAAAISGSRAASAHILASMEPHARDWNTQYWSLKFNTATGTMAAVFNEQAWKAQPLRAAPTSYVAGVGVPNNTVAVRPDMPNGMRQFRDAYNGNLTNIAALNGLDPAGDKGLTPLEIGNFYGAAHITPKSMREQGRQVNPNREIDSALQGVNRMLDDSPNLNSPVHSAIVNVEGTGRNPRSTAEGPGQFTNGTFREQMRLHHPEVQLPSSDAELAPLKNKYGAGLTNLYARDNGQRLADAGLPVTSGNTYLMHFAGPTDGIKLLRADPSIPVQEVISAASYRANPHLHGKTVGETIQWAHRTISRG